jgi:hypothetical protein
MATRRTDPANRILEQITDTNQRRLAREQPFFYEMATKFDTSSCTYLYNQPCGLWNEECHHGSGYIHLSSSTSSTKKKCCANGALSSVSHNFDKELKMRFGMDEMPLFMKLATTRHKFCQDCTNIMGPRGAIHVNNLQAPCRAFLWWDLSWREHVNVTYSYLDSTCFWISTVCSCGLQYGST